MCRIQNTTSSSGTVLFHIYSHLNQNVQRVALLNVFFFSANVRDKQSSTYFIFILGGELQTVFKEKSPNFPTFVFYLFYSNTLKKYI